MEATNYSHKLPVCGWGAHLGHNCFLAVTQCALASSPKGVFHSAMIRYKAAIDPTLFAREVNFSSSTTEVMPQGTTTGTDREIPTPEVQVRDALAACRGILIQAAPTSGIAARCCTTPILRWSLPLPLR